MISDDAISYGHRPQSYLHHFRTNYDIFISEIYSIFAAMGRLCRMLYEKWTTRKRTERKRNGTVQNDTERALQPF